MAAEKFFWRTLSIIISLWVLTKLVSILFAFVAFVVCLALAVGATWWQLRKRKKQRS
ncbi:hypothetical protein HOS55_gp085 [Pseudomonas phage PMBT3]|uniref:Uncharacterized protein n=1 Tax=Pseudomonas phage PMBT3 TaxID=2059856 RepID=A0A2I6PI56_9CAUD|nr:hypothetical protein HOS55_gp085 [Pseudomonas phage PMBT3]AUM59687.1 hypothetical protein [Pseudomonas phage PMBT3]